MPHREKYKLLTKYMEKTKPENTPTLHTYDWSTLYSVLWFWKLKNISHVCGLAKAPHIFQRLRHSDSLLNPSTSMSTSTIGFLQLLSAQASLATKQGANPILARIQLMNPIHYTPLVVITEVRFPSCNMSMITGCVWPLRLPSRRHSKGSGSCRGCCCGRSLVIVDYRVLWLFAPALVCCCIYVKAMRSWPSWEGLVQSFKVCMFSCDKQG